MSQRPPKKKSSASNKSRKTRNRSTAPKAQAQQLQQPAPESPSTASSQPRATRSTDRRTARREEAARKAKQKKQLQLLGGGVAVALLAALVLILVNRPGNDGGDIDYSGIAFAAPPVTQESGTPVADTQPDPNNPMPGAILGDPNAPVTMVVYADFQCPYCRLFAMETQPQIIDDFVRDGKVKLEFREFPVLGGQDLTDDGNTSAQTAEAVLCAAEQGEYLEYHDKLYANQGSFSDSRLKQYADEVGLDGNAFSQCLDSGKYEPAIQQMKAEGQALGINATPMFIINGAVSQMTDQGYDLLKRQLETALETAQ